MERDDGELLHLLSADKEAREVHFGRGEVITHSFNRQQSVYVIRSGFVKAYTIEKNGDRKTQLIYSTDEIFPLGWIIKLRPSSTDFEAMTDCVLLRISEENLLRYINQDVKVANLLLRQTVRQFAIYAARVRNLGFKYGRERLAYRLLFLAYRFGVKTPQGTYLPEFNQVEIAETVNMTRESVNRELSHFERKGVISHTGSRIMILDSRALRKEVGLEDEKLYFDD